jgi:hypothetical protein
MEIRVTIGEGGNPTIESISALEDLWHDFEFFKKRAVELDGQTKTPTDRLIAKRNRRVALLSLLVYFEGVLNRWLSEMLPAPEWLAIERKCVELKVEAIQQRLPSAPGSMPEIAEAKKLRNTLVHLKPGADGEIYDKITLQLLETTETSVSVWLSHVERLLGVERHPNTEAESRELREALGETVPGSAGYTGTSTE